RYGFDFESRLGGELGRLETDGFNYRIPDVQFQLSAAGVELPDQHFSRNETDVSVSQSPISVTLTDIAPRTTLHYTTDGSTATARSPVYSGPLTVGAGDTDVARISAIVVLPSGRAGAPSFLRIYRRAVTL